MPTGTRRRRDPRFLAMSPLPGRQVGCGVSACRPAILPDAGRGGGFSGGVSGTGAPVRIQAGSSWSLLRVFSMFRFRTISAMSTAYSDILLMLSAMRRILKTIS